MSDDSAYVDTVLDSERRLLNLKRDRAIAAKRLSALDGEIALAEKAHSDLLRNPPWATEKPITSTHVWAPPMGSEGVRVNPDPNMRVYLAETPPDRIAIGKTPERLTTVTVRPDRETVPAATQSVGHNHGHESRAVGMREMGLSESEALALQDRLEHPSAFPTRPPKQLPDGETVPAGPTCPNCGKPIEGSEYAAVGDAICCSHKCAIEMRDAQREAVQA